MLLFELKKDIEYTVSIPCNYYIEINLVNALNNEKYYNFCVVKDNVKYYLATNMSKNIYINFCIYDENDISLMAENADINIGLVVKNKESIVTQNISPNISEKNNDFLLSFKQNLTLNNIKQTDILQLLKEREQKLFVPKKNKRAISRRNKKIVNINN